MTDRFNCTNLKYKKKKKKKIAFNHGKIDDTKLNGC